MPEALRVLEPSQGSFAVPEPFRQRSQTEREIAVRAQAKSLLPALFARLELASIPVDESECGQRPTVLGHLQSRRAECFEGFHASADFSRVADRLCLFTDLCRREILSVVIKEMMFEAIIRQVA